MHGPVPVLLTIVAFVALTAALAGVRWRLAAALGCGSLLAVIAAGTAIGIEHKVGSSFPRTFFVWAALPVFAVGLALCGWRHRRWSGRVASVAAVLLLFAFGLDTVNKHYEYMPTVGDALGQPVDGQVRTIDFSIAPKHGVVVSVDIPGTVSRFKSRPAMVWLPPAFFTSPRPQLPVVIMLAGVPGDPTNLLRAAHTGHIANDYAKAHGGRAPILVFPDHNGGFLEDTECVDGPRGAAETYLTVDVPAFVTRTYGLDPARRDWAIIGYSEGGTCATTLALRHPERFMAFVDIAGDLHPNAARGPNEREHTVNRLYGGAGEEFDAHDPLALLRRPMTPPPLAVFAAGTDDVRAVTVARKLASATRGAGVVTSVHLYPGGHNFGLVHRALVDLFPTIADELGNAASAS